MKEMVIIQDQFIKNHIGQVKTRLFLVVAGGDGTLMYILRDAMVLGLDLEHLTGGVCMLPYGTANDLGIIMGWGK